MSGRFHRFIALTTGLAIASQFLPSALAFSDVSTKTGYSTAIEALQQKGVIQGYADGSFKPLDGINRAEFLKILLESRGEVSADMANCFPDVTNEWFARYVCIAKEEGIVSGYPDGTFHPEDPINFVEASKMLSLAYSQHTESNGGEWYEGYGRALESSKAIPPTVAGLDSDLRRGEMAEMMWRLSEEKTDQPSKGLLNVKYPDMKVNLASDEPQLAKSCTDLRAFTESAQPGYGDPVLYNRGMMMEDAVAAPMATGKATQTVSPVSAGSDDFSKTNVQVEGVDEGDRVKTDGAYLYIVSRRDSKVRIVDVRDPQNMKVVSTTSFTGFIPQDLYISGNRLAVTGQVSVQNAPTPMMEDSMSGKMMIYPPIWFVQKAGVRIFDVSDKAHPKETRSLAFEGNTISSRLVGDKMLLVMSSGTRWYGTYREKKESSAAALVPVYDDSALKLKDKPVADCDDVTILPRVPRPEYLVVASIPLQGSAEVGRTVILGNGQNVYASLKNLYVAAPDWSYSWHAKGGDSQQKTTVYRFAYEGNGTAFKAQGSVPGHILNQFSMDEQGDTFRIATTISPSWNAAGTEAKSTNNLYVLESSGMDTVGSVEGIAPGESIYSVRFMGDRAYMVTFKQVDPLFVIDLSSPRSPKILGKLKIPGYSNYLHPVDATHLLGFGKEVDESIDKDKVHSDDAVYYTAVLGMKVALFDVSDVENPKEIHKEVIGARGTDSPLLYDHKALLFDPERGILSFPVTVYEKRTTPKENEWAADTSAVFQGAYVYSFDIGTGFSLKGKISHHTSDDFLKAGDYWYDQSGLDIDRIVRVGEELFTLSEAKIKANGLSSLREDGSLPLAIEAGNEGTYPVPMPLSF